VAGFVRCGLKGTPRGGVGLLAESPESLDMRFLLEPESASQASATLGSWWHRMPRLGRGFPPRSCAAWS